MNIVRLTGHTRSILASLFLLVVVAAAGTSLVLVHKSAGKAADSPAGSSKKQPGSHSTGNSSKNAADTPGSSQAGSTGDRQTTGGTAPAAPSNPACKLLTSALAQQLLGSGAQYRSSADTTTPQTPETSLSSCAYGAGAATLQLSVRTAGDSLGASENATAFGSERPAGVTPVSGYGQSAYWDPASAKLNVLGSNNWYIISRSSGTLQDTEAAAQLLKAGF